SRGTAEGFGPLCSPPLVRRGGGDPLFPLADGRAFAAAIPGATLIAYPGGGHVPMEQIPDRSAADLKAFLQRLPAPREPQAVDTAFSTLR
ncbi:MAG: alpha/beta fold hydrolase, partial [Caulobacteraceae bacterium]